jgi:hypothetical protein
MVARKMFNNSFTTLEIYYNIILSSMPRSSRWHLAFALSNKQFTDIYYFSHERYGPNYPLNKLTRY